MAVEKIPPPQLLTGPEFEGFNRWLLELTKILNSRGTIDGENVDGFDALVAQVNLLAFSVAVLSASVTTLTANVSTLSGQVTTNTSDISTLQGQVAALQARGEVLNGVGAPAGALGKVNDWYANIGGGVGARIYVKTGATTWTAFPF